MKVAIIGHGPSIMDKESGDEIDSHDRVVRIKLLGYAALAYPEIFGTKKDILCMSMSMANMVNEVKNLDFKELWVFNDSRHNPSDKAQARYEELYKKKKIVMDVRLCNDLNRYYRNLRTPFSVNNKMLQNNSSDKELGHNHCSAGLHSLLFACAKLKPETINLYGFDNIKTGDFTWSLTRGQDWDQYPDHRWDIEHKLVDVLRQAYKVNIGFK